MSKQNIKVSPKYILLNKTTDDLKDKKKSSPKKAPRKSIKKDWQYIKKLQAEVAKSKLAAQIIERQSCIPNKFKSSIAELHQELEQSVTIIDSETRKNVEMMLCQMCLKDLIAILSHEMQVLQENEKQQREVQYSATQKKMKKIDYDIQQILQKHNEEIARINLLKEQTSSARSDRVVFSNLFKKIEKEIKHHEQMYRDMVMKTQMMIKVRQELANVALQEDNNDESENKEELEENYNFKFDNGNKFLLAKDETAEKKQTIRQAHHPFALTKRDNPPHMTNTQLKAMINEMDDLIFKITQVTGCIDVHQVLNCGNNVKQSNDRLLAQIEDEERKIGVVQDQIDQIRLQKRRSEIYEQRQFNKLEQFPAMRKYRSNRYLKMTTTEESQQQISSFISEKDIICDVAKLLFPQQQNSIISQDLLLQIDEIIDQLVSNSWKQKQPSHIKTSGDQSLQVVMQKMQKFVDCQKVMQKAQFRQQYIKQLGKLKKIKQRK